MTLFPKPRKQVVAKTPRAPDVYWEAFTEACGVNTDELTTARRAAINGMVQTLKNLGATPYTIHRRAVNCPWGQPTPEQLVKHWAEWGTVPRPPARTTPARNAMEHARRLREEGR